MAVLTSYDIPVSVVLTVTIWGLSLHFIIVDMQGK